MHTQGWIKGRGNRALAWGHHILMMVSNWSGERSLSKMTIIKNRLRTTMNQERLSRFTLLSIEYDILRELDFDDTIEFIVCLSKST